MNSCNCEAGVVASPAPYNKATTCLNPPTQLTTITIPKEKGGDGPNDPYAPKLGAEQNKIVVYAKTGSVYIYDINGVFTALTGESLAKVIAELQQQLDALTTNVEGVQTSVSTETSNREAAIAELTASIQALQTALANEASSREAEDTSLAQQIANIVATSGDVGTALAEEKQAREAADTTLEQAITAETTAREQAVQTLTTELAAKQDTLESGVSIKTINGMTLLGSGNLEVAGGETEGVVLNETYVGGSDPTAYQYSGTPVIQGASFAAAWNTIATKGTYRLSFKTPFAHPPLVSLGYNVPTAAEQKLIGSDWLNGFSLIALDATTTQVEVRYTIPVKPSQLTDDYFIQFNVTAIGVTS